MMDASYEYEMEPIDESFKFTSSSTPRQSTHTNIHSTSDPKGLQFTSTPIKGQQYDELELSCSEVVISSPPRSKPCYECQVCNYITNFKSNLRRHLKVHADVPKVSGESKHKVGRLSAESKPVRYFSCESENCSFITTKKCNLKRHAELHKNDHNNNDISYICETCGKILKSKYAHKLHINSVHLKVYKYNCSTCSRGFNQSQHYKGHLATHLKVLCEKCPLCPAQYNYKKTLQEHVKTVHEGLKFPCKSTPCTSVFSSYRALREHTRAEHDQDRLTCDRCDRTFKWRSSLNYHKTHHK